MRKQSTALILLLALCILLAQCKKEPTKNLSLTCFYPISYTNYSDAGIYKYDDQNRIILDSATLVTKSDFMVRHFTYSGNNVIIHEAICNYNITLNPIGFPVNEIITQPNDTETITAAYHNDSILDSIVIYQTRNNFHYRWSLSDIHYRADGNIISATLSKVNLAQPQIVDYYYYVFDYGADLYVGDFDPMRKLFSISGRRNNHNDDFMDNFSPQPFSPNVVNSATYDPWGWTTGYLYDNHGRVKTWGYQPNYLAYTNGTDYTYPCP